MYIKERRVDEMKLEREREREREKEEKVEEEEMRSRLQPKSRYTAGSHSQRGNTNNGDLILIISDTTKYYCYCRDTIITILL